MHFTLDNFKAYLKFRGQHTMHTMETVGGFEAMVRYTDNPKGNHYSQMFPNTDKTCIVRVSYSDHNNEEMTDGFFIKLEKKSHE